MNPSGQAASPRERELFMQALEQPSGEQREAFLDRACGNDAALRQRLAKLLEQFDRIGTFLDQPAVSVEDRARAAGAPDGAAGGGTVVLPVTEKPGDRIGRYKLLEKIGEGGCGLVYVAEQEEPVRRRVALKVIKLGMDTREVVARFEAERQALALMDHPNIAKVLDAGATETGRPYFVMELVRGIRITDFCDQNQLSTQERLDLFMQVCHAIQHAHQKGIIHRDIKPSNVLVTLHDGVPVPKVIDFGIAKAMEQKLTDKTLYTAFEQFIGTPAYTSPEQAEMSGLDIDTRSDIYALGVLLYELLTGKTPFDGQELVAAGLEEMRRTIREKEPMRPSTRLRTMLNGDLGTTAQHRRTEAPRLIHLLRGDLDWIVMKCLEKDRRRRYETANGVAMDIERHLKHEPVMARHPSTVYRAQKFIRRNKVIVTAGGLVVAALVLGIAGSTWQAVRAARAEHEQSLQRQQAAANEQKALQAQANEARQRQAAEAARASETRLRQQAEAETYAADMSLAEQAVAAGNLGRARELLAHHRPRVGEEDLRGWEWRYLWQRSQSDELFSLSGHSNIINAIAFSPDGRWLASQGWDDTVRLWDWRKRRQVAVQLTTNDPGSFRPWTPILFTRNGQRLLTTCEHRTSTGERLPAPTSRFDDSVIRLWRVPSLEPAGELAHPGPVNHMTLAPDGATLAVATTRRMVLWNTANWQEVTVAGLPLGPYRLATFAPDSHRLACERDDRVVFLADLAQNRSVRLFEWPEVRELGRALAFTPDGLTLLKGDERGVLQIKTLSAGEELVSVPAHATRILEITFSPEGRLMATAGFDQVVRLWDVGGWKPVAALRGHLSEVWSVAFSPDGTTLATSSKDETIKFWSAAPHSMDGTSFRFPTDIRRQATGLFADGALYLERTNDTFTVLDTRTWQATAPERVPDLLLTDRVACAFSPQGRLIVATTVQGPVVAWNLVTKDTGRRFTGHNGRSYAPTFSRDGSRLATAGEDRTFRVWDVESGRQLAQFPNLAEPASVLKLADDGTLLAVGYRTGLIEVWSLASGRVASHLPGHKLGINDLAFLADKSNLISASADGTVRFWDLTGGRAADTSQSTFMAPLQLALSPDGRTLAIGTWDRLVKIWDVRVRREVATLSEPDAKSAVRAAFLPDGNTIVSICPQTVRLWRAPSWAEVQAAEKQAEEKSHKP